MRKFGIITALDFARKDEEFVKERLSKPYREIWQELNGHSVYPVVTETKSSYKSISKAKTFTPPSQDEAFVFAQLAKNLEAACIKARRYKLSACRLIIFLRTQDFRSEGVELRLDRASAFPSDLFGPLKEGFKTIFHSGTSYRQTGVVLAGLKPEVEVQYTLFDDTPKIEKMARVYSAIDELSAKYGKYAVLHGASLPTKLQARHEGERGDTPERLKELFKGENSRQRLGFPVWRIDV